MGLEVLGETSVAVEPGEGALDHPAQLAKSGAVLGLAAGDDRLDASRPEFAAVLVLVIAAVGDQAVGALTGTADLARAPVRARR